MNHRARCRTCQWTGLWKDSITAERQKDIHQKQHPDHSVIIVGEKAK